MHQGNALTTIYHSCYVARGLAGADTPVDLTTEGDFEQLPSDVLDLLRSDIVNPRDTPVFPEIQTAGLLFSFAATAAADKDLNWRLLAWKNENGPAEIVAYGTARTGTQAVVKWPHNNSTATNAFWCDTIVITDDYWPKEIEATAAGGNSISKLFIDSCGYRYFKMEVTLPGIGNDITLASVYYNYF